ncbi:efflux RND transporter permease subunit [Candidatus Ruminimicrobiellum ovillum]|uniref:efflux RND transporter permease subunit n=1 Tax=Candidatus Ruminimicrobiellum ovillum TaxID=1947927 RepID=UPI00355A15B2
MIEFGIKKPVTTLMLVIAMILFSAITTFRIPVELNPSAQSGLVSVITRLRGGVAASEVEKYVTKPLEEVFAELNGLKEMISSSKESESNIMMMFHHNVDTDFIVIDIREKIAMIKHNLPKETEKPIIAKFEQSDSPILILSLSSEEKTPEQLREIAEEQLKEKIMRVAGVANVEFGGGRERKFLIEMDNAKLLGYKLSILEVVQKINLANLSISAGEITRNSNKFVIRATGEYNSIEEIQNTAIAITPSGSIVRIGDIASIRDSYYEPTSYSRLNVQDVVSIYIQKESTANTITVAKEALQIIDKLKEILDPDINITIVKNDAEYIQKAISSLVEALVLGGIILAGVLFLFMKNVRSIFIVATTMPLSLFMCIILMYFTNQTFNIMTLSGLAMGMANVMDNSIVVLENIAFHHHRKTFATKAELVVRGTAELWQPIFASTVTTIIVFLPLVFLEPEIRQMYVPFGLTITFALVASVVATMMFIPVEIYRWQNKFDLDFQKWYIKVRHIYGRILKFCFKWQTYVWLFTLLLFLLSAKIMMTRDSEFMDPGSVNTFRIGVQFPPATRIEVSNEVVRKMEQALMSYHDWVERVSSKVEKLHTFVEVTVYERAEEFKEEFRKRFGEFSPAFVYFQDSQSSASKEIYVDFYGQNYDTLKQLAFSASGRLQQVKGLTDVKIRMREDEPEVILTVDYDRLAVFGLTTYYFSNTLHCQLRGLIATQYRTEGKQIETICRLYPDSITNVEQIPFIGVVNPRKDVVYVGQVTDMTQLKSNQEIWRKNKKRFIQISANRAKIGLTTAAEKIKATLKGVAFPQDYSFNISGDYEKTVKNRGQFMLAVALVIILIFFVLASIFESYMQPALIMFALPLSMIGVAFSLWIFKKPISLGVWIGIMILFGCIVYSSIIIVDKINQRRVGRTNLLRVIFESCKERLRPELITMLMKTLGLLPMVLSRDESASMWRSLGLTVLCGTITGTLLTMLIIPTAYYVLERPKSSFYKFFKALGLMFLFNLFSKMYKKFSNRDREEFENI